MNIVVLGRGKTGALVAEVARERGHHVRAMASSDNPQGKALAPEKLRDVNVVIDFTTPDVVLDNVRACMAARKSMVVGTTGWYGELPAVRKLVEKSGAGFLYGSNFSIGVNLFFEVSRTAAAALKHGYHGQIMERHHVHKKDAPSGTALVLQKVVRETGGTELEIISFREGEVVGLHELVFESPHDEIRLAHDATSRRGFAEGAVRGAEWLAGRTGFYNFADVWREM